MVSRQCGMVPQQHKKHNTWRAPMQTACAAGGQHTALRSEISMARAIHQQHMQCRAGPACLAADACCRRCYAACATPQRTWCPASQDGVRAGGAALPQCPDATAPCSSREVNGRNGRQVAGAATGQRSPGAAQQ